MKKTVLIFALISASCQAFAHGELNDTLTTKNEQQSSIEQIYDSLKENHIGIRRFSKLWENGITPDWDDFFESDFKITTRFKTEKTDKQYIIKLEVPGYEKEQIKIEIQDGNMIISTRDIPDLDKNKSHDSLCKGLRSFRQIMSLPSDIDKEGIAPTLKNGILTITIPRIPNKAKESREIPIKT